MIPPKKIAYYKPFSLYGKGKHAIRLTFWGICHAGFLHSNGW
jgi:hypothetical protein